MSGLHNATFRQLQIFASAARHQSFSRASAELHLTQPAVSMQVRQLEENAGVSLFERVGRRVSLTSAGHELLAYAQRILGAIQDAEDTFATIKAVDSGKLTIAVVSTAKYFAPKLLAQFQQQHPNVELRLDVNNREAVVAQLTANEIDLAIMGTPPRSVATDAAPFAPHPLVVIAPPDHHSRAPQANSAARTRRRNVPRARAGLRHTIGDGTAFPQTQAARSSSAWKPAATRRSNKR